MTPPSLKLILIIAGLLSLAAMAISAALVFTDRYQPVYVRHVWTRIHGISLLRDQRVPMGDGIELATDVYLPRRHHPPYPVVYVQTPYGKSGYFGGLQALQWFAPRGYAIVVQDVRGRYKSGGEFRVYDHAVEDGWDTLDWIVAQPWSNGRIGTYGCSALGEVQYMLASAAHPNHDAMIVMAGGGAIGKAAGRYGYFGLYEGGVFNLASGVGWFADDGAKQNFPVAGQVDSRLLEGLPIVELVARSGAPPTDYEDFVSHPPGDPWWDQFAYIDEANGFEVPGLHVNSWYDLGAEDTITLALGGDSKQRALQRVIMSPATHCQSDHLGPEARIGDLPVAGANRDYQSEFAAWFDHWLKDAPLPEGPTLSVFVLGADRWIDLDQWPPGEVREWYLSSHRGANGAAGDGRLVTSPPERGIDRFSYDPLNPVRTRGGVHCCTGNPDDQPGAFDQAASASRSDVLVYDSSALGSPLTVIGPIRARLEVSTSAADTDFTAKLVDVWPDGRAFNVQDGVFRLRYRDGYETPRPARAGDWYEIEIGLRATAYRFNAGHRLRLEVSSSNFPRLARNLNTGGAPAFEVTPVTAVNAVAHGGERPSALRLRVYFESSAKKNPP